MRFGEIRGIAAAQARTRAVVHDVAEGLREGDTERSVAERIEGGLERSGVGCWLHTPYAWFGERTRFAGFHDWEPDALPTERRLAPGEPFILDAAPFVDGHPADYAFSGVLEGSDDAHRRLCEALTLVKTRMVGWAREANSGKALFEAVGAAAAEAGLDAVHPLYPGAVLGHRFDALPRWLQRLPRVGWGFQLPLVAGYGLALFRHRLTRAPYPLLNHVSAAVPRGVFAVELAGSGPVWGGARMSGERRVLERALDVPQRIVLRLPLPPNGRIVIRGTFGFLKQVLRSRALRLRRSPRD